MMNILIWLAIIVLAFIVIKFITKFVLVLVGLGIMLKQEYDTQKQLGKLRGKK